MKTKNILLLVIMTALIIPVSAQEYVKGVKRDLEESIQSMSAGSNNALTLELDNYDKRLAESVWKDFLKKYKGKTKKVKRSDEWFTDDADVGAISSSPVDIYSTIRSTGSGSELTLWVDLGGTFVNSEDHESEFEGVTTFLAGYKRALNMEMIKKELSDQESELKKLERQLVQLEKQNERFHKEIEAWKKRIVENEEKIDLNIADQGDMRSAIEMQKEKVRDVEIKLAKAEG